MLPKWFSRMYRRKFISFLIFVDILVTVNIFGQITHSVAMVIRSKNALGYTSTTKLNIKL